MIERQLYKESSSIGNNLEPRAAKVVGYMRGHLLPAITTSDDGVLLPINRSANGHQRHLRRGITADSPN